MAIKAWPIICTFSFILVSPTFADIVIMNNTDYYGTASLSFTPCSSVAGESGIVKPHAKYVISQSRLKVICKFNCNASVYTSKNCSGKKLATVTVNPDKGVISINNLNSVRFDIIGKGNYIVVNQKRTF